MFEAWLEVDLLLKMYLQVVQYAYIVSFDAATRDNANMDDVCVLTSCVAQISFSTNSTQT